MRHGDGSVFQEKIDIANYVIVKKLVMNFIIYLNIFYTEIKLSKEYQSNPNVIKFLFSMLQTSKKFTSDPMIPCSVNPFLQ